MIQEYRVFDSKDQRRLVIAPADHKDYLLCEWTAGTFAESWLDAKKRLGFELTAAQQWLHDRQQQAAA